MGERGRCTWDDAKAASNAAKHGLAFPDLAHFFDGRPIMFRQDLRRDYGEPRFNALVMLEWLVVNITFTPRYGRFHLISARPASREERKVFHDAKEDTQRGRDRL